MAGGGVGMRKSSRAGTQCSLSRAVHRWRKAGQAVPVTSFSEAASHDWQSTGPAPGML